MKCCLISPFPPDKCGIALYAYRLARELKNHCELVVLANEIESPSGIDSRSIPRAVRCWRRDTLSYPIRIFKAALRERPDVIHIQHEFLAFGSRKHSAIFPALLVLLKLIGPPVIMTMHSVLRRSALSGDFFNLHGVGSKLPFMKKLVLILFVKLIAALSDAVIVHNELMKIVLMKDYAIPSEKIHVIPHGVELKTIEPKQPSQSSDGLLIAFFGFVIPDKGIETLLRAFQEVLKSEPSVRLIIAGGYHPRLVRENPGYIGTVERLIGELGLSGSVRFLNAFISEEELESILRSASLIVLPYSEDRIIGSSGALASCAKFGKPVVATRIPRFSAELGDCKEALLVSPGNSGELAKGILKCLRDEGLRESLGRSLRSWGEGRAWGKVAELTANLYEEIAGWRDAQNLDQKANCIFERHEGI